MQTLQDAYEHEPVGLLSSHLLTGNRIDYAREHMRQDVIPVENEALKKLWEQIKAVKKVLRFHGF